MQRKTASVTALVVLLLTGINYAWADTVVTLPLSRFQTACSTLPPADPVAQSYILFENPNPGVKGTFLLFSGGKGKLKVADGELDVSASNFLVRSRWLFASQKGNHGFQAHVAVMDAATDFLSCPDGLKGQRLTDEYRRDMAVVMLDLRARCPGLKVWAVGTSRGSIAAAQAAAELPAGSSGPDGIGLTSTVTQGGLFNTVFDVALNQISVPTLVAHHKNDTCSVSPPADTPAIVAALTGTTTIKVREFKGGLPAVSDECKGLSPHGYYGIEPRTVRKITVNGSSKRRRDIASGGVRRLAQASRALFASQGDEALCRPVSKSSLTKSDPNSSVS